MSALAESKLSSVCSGASPLPGSLDEQAQGVARGLVEHRFFAAVQIYFFGTGEPRLGAGHPACPPSARSQVAHWMKTSRLPEVIQWSNGKKETVRAFFQPIGADGNVGVLVAFLRREAPPEEFTGLILRLCAQELTRPDQSPPRPDQRRMVEDQMLFQASLLDQVCNAVIATDLSGKIIHWNRFAETLYQWNREEVIGRNVVEILVPVGHQDLAGQILKSIEETGYWEGEFPVRRKDGSVFDAYVVDAVLKDRNQQVYGLVGVSVDITERKRAEELLRSSKEQLRALSAHLQWVREKERSHIAREIHDELGQSLTGLKIDLSWLDHRLQDAQNIASTRLRLIEKVHSMSDLVDSTIKQVRKITTELRPRILDEFGLPAAIEWQTREFEARTGLRCRLTTNVETIALDDHCATTLFRIFQETLTNILRHSGGTEVKVLLQRSKPGLLLEVRDNGRGISRKKVWDSASLGLLGMRERALLSHGELTITGIRGKGTTVRVWIPGEKRPALADTSGLPPDRILIRGATPKSKVSVL